MSGIYKINCKQREKVYIGQTKKNLEMRTKEHFRNLRLNHTDKSAITSHFLNTGHEINNSVNLLKSVNRKNELISWEKICIHKHAHHIMNFEVPPEGFLIKK
jgi:GIY-YIG catalytic domain.